MRSLLGSAARGNLACNLRRLLLRNRCRRQVSGLVEPPYRSQVGQDRFLDEFVFHGRRAGVFVDIGAHDGVTLSNSYYFEKELGWNGLCVEPNPARYKELTKSRRAQTKNCGVGPTEGRLKFLQLPAHLDLGSGFLDYFAPQSEFAERHPAGSVVVEIPVLRLTELLASARFERIDYLSIDTEGADFDIIRSLDFTNCDISTISVENSGWDERIAAYLGSNGYSLIAVLGSDEIYLKRELEHTFPLRGWRSGRASSASA